MLSCGGGGYGRFREHEHIGRAMAKRFRLFKAHLAQPVLVFVVL